MLQNSVLFAATLACGASALAQTPCDSSARSETLLGGNVGARGVPTIEFDGSPVVGRPFGLWIENGAPNSIAFVAVSGFGAPVPLTDLDAISHLLPPYAALVQTAVNAQGRSSLAFDLPTVAPSFCGVELFVQGVVVDAAAPGWLAVSHARRFVIGSEFEPKEFVMRSTALTHLLELNSNLIARGDLDGDSLSDVVVATSFLFGPLKIFAFLSTGDGRFASPFSLTVANAASDLALVDLDGDGALDCVTTHSSNGQVQVRLGSGDGTFGSVVAFASGNGATQVESGDFTGDGHVDLVVVNFIANTLTLHPGDGTGTFGGPSIRTTGAQPIALEVDDVDGDGDLDCVVLASSAQSLTVFRNDASGGLAPDAPIVVGMTAPTTLELLDITGDGVGDLVVGGTFGTLAFEGHGDGTFTAHFDPALVSIDAGYFMSSDDVNGDGQRDLLFGSQTAIGYRLVGSSGGLEVPNTYHLGEAPAPYSDVWGMAFVVHDFDSDGFEDIVAPFGRLAIQRGEAAPLPAQRDEFEVGGADIGFMRIEDADGDGLAEVLTSASTETFIRIANSHPQDDGSVVVVDMSRLVSRFENVDINGDGRLDLVSVSSLGPGTVDHHVVRFRQPSGSYAAPSTNDIARSQSPAFANIDGDDILDIVVKTSNGTLAIYRGKSDGTLESPLTVAVPTGTQSADLPCLADVDGDGLDDFMSRGGVALGIGNGSFAAPIVWSVSQPGFFRQVEVTDFDRDGIVDVLLLTRVSTTPLFEFRRGLGGGAFSAPLLVADGNSDSAAMGDFDGDRLGDVAVIRNRGVHLELVVHHGNGAAGFHSPVFHLLSRSLTQMAVGDVNGDGIDDVAHSVRTASQGALNTVRILRSQLLDRP